MRGDAPVKAPGFQINPNVLKAIRTLYGSSSLDFVRGLPIRVVPGSRRHFYSFTESGPLFVAFTRRAGFAAQLHEFAHAITIRKYGRALLRLPRAAVETMAWLPHAMILARRNPRHCEWMADEMHERHYDDVALAHYVALRFRRHGIDAAERHIFREFRDVQALRRPHRTFRD